MFELLGLVFGGVFRLVPEVFRLWDKNKDREHEKNMLALQMQADEARSKLAMQQMELQGNIAMNGQELAAIIEATKAQATETGIKWVDALSALVRPLLTYWYCIFAYGSYKVSALYLALHSGASWLSAVGVLWTSEDHAVMLSIIGFWFVDRAIRKQGK